VPALDGGCPIFDYSVERDADGSGQVWTEVNPLGTYPRNDPNLLEFTCDRFPAEAQVGQPFLFRVIAFNTQGSVTSLNSA